VASLGATILDARFHLYDGSPPSDLWTVLVFSALGDYPACAGAKTKGQPMPHGKSCQQKIVPFIDLKTTSLSPEAQNHTNELKLRAERRLGEMLQEEIPHQGGRPSKNPTNMSRVFQEDTSLPSLSTLGISYNQSSRWQQIASLSAEDFETYLAESQELGGHRAGRSLIY